MSSSPTSNSSTTPSMTDTTQWLDFYSILGVSPDVDEDTLRARIGAAYIEAMRNVDHRQVERRMHFQVMCHRIIPQARRILLEERTRQAYDKQLERHLCGDKQAISYTTFVTQLKSIEAGEDPFPTTILPSMQEEGEAITLTTQIASEDAQNLLDNAHQVLMTEQRYADMAPIPTLGDDIKTHQERGFFVIDPDLDNVPELPVELPSEATDLDIPEISVAEEKAEEEFLPIGRDASSGYLMGGDEVTAPIPERTQVSARQLRSKPARSPEKPASAAPVSGLLPPDSPIDTSMEAAFPSSAIPTSIPATPAPTQTQTSATSTREISSPDARTGFSAIPEEVKDPPSEIRAKVLRVMDPPASVEPESDEFSSTLPSSIPSVATLTASVASAPIQGGKEENPATRTPPTPPPAGFSTLPEEIPSSSGEVRAQVLRADGSPVNNYSTAERGTNLGLNELDDNIRGVVTAHRTDIDENSRFTTRIDIGEVDARAANAHRFRQGKRILSQRLLFVLTGITALCFMYLIQLQWKAAAIASQPMRIVYASALHPVMGPIASAFLKTPEATGISIELRATDARDAMQVALLTGSRGDKNRENVGSDIWIPSESLWSDRYNAVAAERGQRPLMGARALALTPLVLMVRSDRALTLRRRFPNRIISSWDALREAVTKDASGHFGLTDPQKSGSGALARYFMAREWSQKNGISWDATAAKDKRMWLWMNGIENNVASYARLTSDMAKDLALGSGDRYWWAIVYESDALGWMKRTPNVEVFYLPQTAYADHPFCTPDQPEIAPHIRQARAGFERYMRSASAQKMLLENGFRPTEISILQVPNNLFTRPDFKKRGVRVSGFRVDERINYRILNELTAQWKQRY